MATINILGTGTPGQAITKNVSDNTKTVVASVTGAFTTNNLVVAADTNGTIQNLASTNSAVLVTSSTGAPTYSGTMSNGQIIIGSTGATPVAATLTAGSNINITNAAGAITIATTGAASFSFTDVTGVSQTMVANNGYIANNAGLVTFTLPTTAAVGTVMEIVGAGAGGWLLAQNAGQSILAINVTTTVGVGGSLASTNTGDGVRLVCTIANTKWTAIPTGNLTIV